MPTAAPQSLTVNGLLNTSAAVGALELYAQAQNVTLQNSFETETADLVILDAPPQDDGTWKNLAENELLAAAAQRAGLDTESTVTALPVGQSLYAYWADNRVLTELLQSDAALDDLRAATWEEWFDFVTAVTHWCAEPGAVQVTLNGNAYTLPAERRETLANLNGVFAAQEPEVSGNSGDGGVAENTPALYTTALLAGGAADRRKPDRSAERAGAGAAAGRCQQRLAGRHCRPMDQQVSVPAGQCPVLPRLPGRPDQ